MWRFGWAVVGLLLVFGGRAGRAHELYRRPGPPVREAPQAVLDAVAAGGGPALVALAEQHPPDPWLVAEDLCRLREYDAAAAFARAAPGPAVEGLPAYVEARRRAPTDRAEWEASDAIFAAARAGAWKTVLALTETLRPPHDSARALRHALARGDALKGLGRIQASVTVHRAAASEAKRMGWTRWAALCHARAGEAAASARDWRGALADLQAAVAAYAVVGDRAQKVHNQTNLGLIYYRVGDLRSARKILTQAVTLSEEMKDETQLAIALAKLGPVLRDLGEYADARLVYERALAFYVAKGDRRAAAGTLGNLANLLRQIREYDRAQYAVSEALAVFEELGDRRTVAMLLGNEGIIQDRLGNDEMALRLLELTCSMMEKLRDSYGMSRVLLSIGSMQVKRFELTKAQRTLERALELALATGDRDGQGRCYGSLARIHGSSGRYGEALEAMERSREIAESIGRRPGVADATHDIGMLHDRFSRRSEALDAFERALALYEAIGDAEGVARALSSLGFVHSQLGDYPTSFDCLQRAMELFESVGSSGGVRNALVGMAHLHEQLGDFPAAMKSLQAVVRMLDSTQETPLTARVLGDIGRLLTRMGRLKDALALIERAADLYERLNVKEGRALILSQMGWIHAELGNHQEALQLHLRARDLGKEMGARGDIVMGLTGIGSAYLELGRPAEALAAFQRGLALLADSADVPGAARMCGGIAQSYERMGEYEPAIASARDAARAIDSLVGGLGEQQGASTRDRWTSAYRVGVKASLGADSVEDLVYFLESGRAGGLREALGARRALQSTLVPPELRDAEDKAVAREANALARYESASSSGRRAAIRDARQELEEARDAVADVVQRIQREAKAGADLAYPKAAALTEIQEALAPHEALVLYGQADTELVAAVVTREIAVARVLGPAAALESRLLELDFSNVEHETAEDVNELRRLLTEPLGLTADTRRVLVSPLAALAYVPFSVLFPEREVSYVASGTTYRLLTEQKGRRGKKVLSVGDPDYGVPFDPRTIATVRGGRALQPLPHTRDEATTVGDVVLLGAEASEQGLTDTLPSEDRWRAIHFACHGLIDAERPLFSSLALTPGSGSDGLLTVHEVFRLRAPADLVVLSACETARGRVYRSDGIVGLTRAFMFAGAPRVLCSLWRVDDEATRALMIRFYELWHPAEGKGLPAAAALKQAQEHVRDHPAHAEWKHPYYWAAWVLWGLPQ